MLAAAPWACSSSAPGSKVDDGATGAADAGGSGASGGPAPVQEVTWGEGTLDEMCLGSVQMTADE
jgi:hypothetical protein